MKTKVFYMAWKIAFITILMIPCASNIQAQTIDPYCSGNMKIIDDNPQFGDYYEVFIRVETTTPSTSDWEYVGQYTYSASDQPFGPTQVYDVPKPVPVPPNFYTIRLFAIKYDINHTEQGNSNNTSLATLDANDDLSANNTIELKW